jgi:hypothetical protein
MNEMMVKLLAIILSILLIGQLTFGQNSSEPEHDSINFNSVTDSIIKQELASFTVKGVSYLKTDSLSSVELKEIPVRICSENEVYLSLSTFFSSVSTYIHLYFKGEIPDRMLDSIFLVTHSHFRVKFPQEAFQGLLQPNSCELFNNGSSPYFKAFYSKDKKRLYIYMLGGSGTNKYEVTWIIINDRYYTRVFDRLHQF